MTRVLLVNPPSPHPLGTPLLGLHYVAAALLARGCEVRVVDAAARHFVGDADTVLAEAERFAPDMVGVGLTTRWVWHAYRLAERLRGHFPLLVAGGPHATVCPDETLEHGFDAAVAGEAEEAIVRLVDAVEGRHGLDAVPGLRYRAPDGEICSGPPARPVENLDALPSPVTAHSLFDPRWYQAPGVPAIPGGILTSRGCPGRCIFCANYVTGRRVRHRGAEAVAAELNAWHEQSGLTFYPFYDDAFTADPQRVLRLCEVLRRDVRFPLQWSAITRADMVTPELLRAMREAGLVAINIGVESGDDETLRAIGKGITTAQVVQALEWARAEGLLTICNFMLGFPQETPRALERTLGFLERIAPLTSSFGTLGVVVPYPGTPLYRRHHERYGFTGWWLRETWSHYRPAPPYEERERFRQWYRDDPTLDVDFYHYPEETRELIRACLEVKAEHNLKQWGLTAGPELAANERE